MADIKRQQLELENIVQTKGGKIIETFKKPTIPIILECSKGHRFEDLFRNIKAGAYCKDCLSSHTSVALKKIRDLLVENGFESKRNAAIPGHTGSSFDLGIEDGEGMIFIDYDDEEIFKDKKAQEGIVQKVNLALSKPNYKIIRVNTALINDISSLDKYLWDSITGDNRLNYPDLNSYLWLANKVVEKKEEKKVDKTVLGPFSEIIEGDGEPLPALPHGKFAIIGYCRVSTQDQAQQGISLQTQVDKIKQLSNLKGFPLVKIYLDKGISGKNLTSRPAMVRALDDLKPGYYLAVYSLSRLARNNRQAIEILDKIREKGAFLISLDYDIDTRTSIGQLIYNVLSALSQFESDQISERVRSNMDSLSRHSKLRSRPSFGWDFVGKGLPFVRNEHEQQIIEFIRKLKEEDPGITCTAVAKTLNTRGLTTKRGKPFYQNTVRKIMEDNLIIPHKSLEDRLRIRKKDDEIH